MNIEQNYNIDTKTPMNKAEHLILRLMHTNIEQAQKE